MDEPLTENQMECLELQAKIEDELNRYPVEIRDMLYNIYAGDLMRFLGLLKQPRLKNEYILLSLNFLRALQDALDAKEDTDD